MSGDFTVERPFSYVAGALIDPDENNPNENTLYDAHNAAFHATTGHAHSGATGDAPQIPLTTGITGALPVANGGTNITSYTIGDMLYASASGVLSKLAGVATGNVLISGGVATAPSWGKVDLTAHITGVLPVANGGTNIASYTIGDILYASASGVLSKLAGVATGNALISGGVATAPSWGKIGLTTHVSGTLPAANGGTGVTTSTGSGANVLSTSPSLTTPSIAGCTMSGTWTSSSCTLSGTFAGTPTFSGVVTFSDEVVMADVDPPTANRVNRNGNIKGWVNYADGSGSAADSYNVSSIGDDDGDGIFHIVWDTNFNDANFQSVVGIHIGPTLDKVVASLISSTTQANIYIYDISTAANADGDFMAMAIGDQ